LSPHGSTPGPHVSLDHQPTRHINRRQTRRLRWASREGVQTVKKPGRLPKIGVPAKAATQSLPLASTGGKCLKILGSRWRGNDAERSERGEHELAHGFGRKRSFSGRCGPHCDVSDPEPGPETLPFVEGVHAGICSTALHRTGWQSAAQACSSAASTTALP
jgi:hypothetical protein